MLKKILEKIFFRIIVIRVKRLKKKKKKWVKRNFFSSSSKIKIKKFLREYFNILKNKKTNEEEVEKNTLDLIKIPN